MSRSPSSPERYRRTARFAGTALLSVAVAAGVAGAAFGGVGTLLDAALGSGALGLVASLYGLGRAQSGPAVRLSTAGLVLATVAVAAVPLGPFGAEFGVPGGPWGLLYAAGVLLVVIAEGAIPALGPPEDEPRGSNDDGGRPPDTGGAPVTVAIGRDEGGTWSWRLETPGERVLAVGPQRYDTATAAHAAASRVADRIPGAEPRVVADGETNEADRGAEDDAENGDPGLPPAHGDRPDPDAGGTPRSEGRTEFVGGDETAVFEIDGTGEGWRWRLRFGDDTVVAESGRAFPGLDAARRAIDRVRSTAPGAGALTYDPGAFEVYRNPETDRWSWRLRGAEGEVIATAVGTFESRGGGFAAVESVKATTGEGPEIRDAEGHHDWTLSVDDEVIARSPHGFETAADAREAFESVATVVPDAGVLNLDPAGFEVGKRSGGTWGWRLRHRDGRVLAESPAQATRDRTIEGLRTVQRVAPDADVAVGDRDTARVIEEALSDAAEARSMAERLSAGEDDADVEDGDDAGDGDGTASGDDDDGNFSEDGSPAESERGGTDGGTRTTLAVLEGDGWEWELRRGDTVLVRGGSLPAESVAVEAAARVARVLSRATVVRVDPVAVTVTADGWRLVDRDGAVLARSPPGEDSRGHQTWAAESALRAMEGSAEVYREEGWRWRVRDEGDVVATAGRGFETPERALAAFESLPDGVADAPVVECETTAEVTPAEDGSWRFRVRDGAGAVVASGDRSFPTAAEAVGTLEAAVADLSERPDPVVGSDDGNGSRDDPGDGR